MTYRVHEVSQRQVASAAAIHGHAKAELIGRLWKAALGQEGAVAEPSLASDDGWLLLLAENAEVKQAPVVGDAPLMQAMAPPPLPAAARGFEPALADAAARTGIPQTVLAAIVDAEAGSRGGTWNTAARNPRSSAAGLGQFLAGTWISEAQRPGTYLNNVAGRSGWLDEQGRVRSDARDRLLGLRFDGTTSIQAIADFARSNLDRLDVSVSAADPRQLARAAYVAHHLGLGDARRYLAEGLGEARAATLLSAQIGVQAAGAAVARAGGAQAAHRAWLEQFIARKVLPTVTA